MSGWGYTDDDSIRVLKLSSSSVPPISLSLVPAMSRFFLLLVFLSPPLVEWITRVIDIEGVLILNTCVFGNDRTFICELQLVFQPTGGRWREGGDGGRGQREGGGRGNKNWFIYHTLIMQATTGKMS